MNASGRLIINAVWDDEVRVWVATSDEVPGLATETEDMEALVEKLKKMIPELLDANGAAFEVKSSIQAGGWQGHNPEDCWLMVFRYAVGEQADGAKLPLTFIEILCAKVEHSDWSFSGRKGSSRRTPTASITTSGVEKLRRNFLYRVPGVGVGAHREVLAEQ